DIKPFAIKRPYIIYASSMLGDDKKHIELIEAFEKFKRKTNLPHKLVLSGSEGPSTSAIHQAIMKSEYASDILMTGYFPHESLPELYACAAACVFPSVCEGVGLPVLEAMSTGLPVTCSSSGALPEMAGDNALYFNSDDTDEMAACIERIITDEELRAKLIAGGLERAKDFSWEKTAEETLLLLRQVSRL
ncbi:MAG: glycosyltransferase family 4 protein, partial [Treponema sp.]|nr:glycosyltransferase family 4 protein [Treponema sp.]